MTDTAQPTEAAETEVVSREESFANAAEAFKVSLGQSEQRPRDEHGRFISAAPEEEAAEGEEQIEAEAEGGAPEADAERHEDGEDKEEAAEEAQPADVPLPASWPAEQAETWKALPPDTQAFIAEREGQRDAAVNAKFQEAANVRRAAEARSTEAQATIQQAMQAHDLALSLIQPQQPPFSMLDPNSSDYDPDGYHLARARYDQSVQYLNGVQAQRQQLAAQEQELASQAEAQRFLAINQATAPAFVRNVPEVSDQAKAPEVLKGLMEYAVSQGAPAEIFQTPTTALEWHVLWKAQQYDRLQEAKAKVQAEPKPKPKAQPPVRPGVTTPRSAVQQQKRKAAMDRLSETGSIQDGAAALKHLLRGMN